MQQKRMAYALLWSNPPTPISTRDTDSQRSSQPSLISPSRDIPGVGCWRRQTGALAFNIPGGRYWCGRLGHWPSIALVGDVGYGGLGH
ncbi:hypothetical protein PoB_003648700 [Plakobranchus ocellatus]|uniref:Uncharacterized protein n=1 Tax=Plakobranchus ocellatus TaxID=259542 RepID=A0AAV4ARM4_9GAST|nr:hypothetical protein PoB_003648700 [Plakobranchus ocellatus]